MAIYAAYYIYVIAFYYFTSRVYIRGSHGSIEQFAYSGRKKLNERIYVYFCILSLVIIMGLRAQDMGVDLAGYLSSYEIIGGRSWKLVLTRPYLNYEKGFLIWMKLCYMVSDNKQFFLFACAFLSIAPVAYLFLNYSRHSLISIIVYMGTPLFLIFFSGLRQGIAIGIICISYVYLINRKIIPFCFSVCLASVFHSSALIFFFAYPMYWLKIRKSYAAALVILIPVVYAFKSIIYGLLSGMLWRNAHIDNNGAYRLLIVLSSLYLLCTLLGSRDSNERINGCANLLLIAAIIQAMGGVYSGVLRMGYYFLLSLSLLIPEIKEDIFKSQRRSMALIVSLLLFVFFLSFGFYSLMTGSWARSNPYHFFWQGYLR